MVGRFLIYLLLVFAASAPAVSAESLYYFYDETGRLIKAVSEAGESVVYEYDAVGNLISIAGPEIAKQPPELNGISPDVVFVGKTAVLSIQGKNLFSVKEVVPESAGVLINSFSSSDTALRILASIDAAAQTGQTNLKVKSLYGSADINLNIARLSFDSSRLVMSPGRSADVEASIEGYPGDITIPLNNINPGIVSAPSAIALAGGQSAIFSVSALNEGVAVLSAANVAMSVYVSAPFSGEAAAETAPVSVAVEQPPVQAIAASLPVSVGMALPPLELPAASFPVSVQVASAPPDWIEASPPVSVGMEPALPPGDYKPSSAPVSVITRPAPTMWPEASLPVSVRVDLANPLWPETSLPVSVTIEKQ